MFNKHTPLVVNAITLGSNMSNLLFLSMMLRSGSAGHFLTMIHRSESAVKAYFLSPAFENLVFIKHFMYMYLYGHRVDI